jgi:hypothetical protein
MEKSKMYKIGIKKMATQFDIELEKIISIFHEWIQNDIISEHLTIDVVDYKHVPDGPGIMLIMHEGNISIDFENNEIGLLYIRKQPLSETLLENIIKIKSILIFFINELENHKSLKGKICFNGNYKIISNDRLHLPDNDSSKDLLIKNLKKVFQGKKLSIINSNINSRLTIEIQK